MTEEQYKIKNDELDKCPRTYYSPNPRTTFCSLFNKSKKYNIVSFFIFYYPILFSFSIYFFSLFVTFLSLLKIHVALFALPSPRFSFRFSFFLSFDAGLFHFTSSVGTLAAVEGYMDYCYFFFAHYFFLFIVNLLKCSHCHLPPFLFMFFFFLTKVKKYNIISIFWLFIIPYFFLSP